MTSTDLSQLSIYSSEPYATRHYRVYWHTVDSGAVCRLLDIFSRLHAIGGECDLLVFSPVLHWPIESFDLRTIELSEHRESRLLASDDGRRWCWEGNSRTWLDSANKLEQIIKYARPSHHVLVWPTQISAELVFEYKEQSDFA